VPASGPSDYYVVNTCTVTARADSETRSLVRSLHRLNRNARIVVTGCYVEAHAEEALGLPGVAMAVGNRDKNQIIHRLTGLEEAREEPGPFFAGGISGFAGRSKAFVKIQDGCNYYCSFCKIPMVRGRLRSRSGKDILEEVRRLADSGFRELVLSGVCLGSYGRDTGGQSRLAHLIEKVVRIPGDFRVRLSSIDPRDTPESLADLMRDSGKLCRHLHLSLQSGSDAVLKGMMRGTTTADFETMVRRFRERVPGLGLTTDVIVGFPGEDTRAFEATRSFIRKIGFHHVHLFAFSARKGTRAASLGEKVPSGEIKRRIDVLKEDVRSCAGAYFESFIGRTLNVLAEGRRRRDGRLQGFSEQYIRCVFDGPQVIEGQVVRVKAEAVQDGSIFCLLTY